MENTKDIRSNIILGCTNDEENEIKQQLSSINPNSMIKCCHKSYKAITHIIEKLKIENSFDDYSKIDIFLAPSWLKEQKFDVKNSLNDIYSLFNEKEYDNLRINVVTSAKVYNIEGKHGKIVRAVS
jgi:hypothetical protein